MLDLAVLVAFLLLLVVIGRVTAARVHSAEDYHLCGRRLNRLPAALSLAATEFNGSGLVGGAGLAYTVGVAGSFWNFAAVPAWLVLGATVVIAFRRLGLYTMPELLESRYGPSARRLASASQLASGVLFVGVQILVSGLVLSALLDVPREGAMVVITAVCVAYTFAGGLLAVVWTDVACFFVLMTAVVAAVPVALSAAGGWQGMLEALPAGHFDFASLGVAEPVAWVALCFYSYATDQAYLQRVFAAERPEIARFAYNFTGVNYLIFGGAVALLGMTAAVLHPGLGHDDQALPALVAEVFPPGVRSVFLAGLIAATDQAYLQRVFAAERPEVARFAYNFTGVNYLIFGGAVALLGMAAAVLHPGLAHDDQALPTLVAGVFPPGVRSVFLAGLIAATLSTASSYLSAASSLFLKDVWEPLLARRRSERDLLRVSRLATPVFALVALAFALGAPRIVDAVVLSVLVSHAAVFVPLIAALYSKSVARAAGFWSILAGAAGGLAAHLFLYSKAPFVGAVHPLFFGPLCSLAVLLLVRPRRGAGGALEPEAVR